MTKFTGTDRFEIRKKLGAGASGTVFETYDHDRKATVALKVLNKMDPGAIYRFKQEFRSLADVNHPNLVQFHELLSHSKHWFFTMELVRGESFLEYVRGESDLGYISELDQDTHTYHRSATTNELVAPAAKRLRPSTAANFEEVRLRSALRQLSEGLAALHSSGKLHRDIKPSNVMVTRLGRVVLLDFGLARDVVPDRLHQTCDDDVVGTPAYMAPEQAAGMRVSSASDWYSVGAMLYQALTSRIPFTGNVIKILTDKQIMDPKPPRELNDKVPDDLETLCRSLLQRLPDQRPAGRDVLIALGSSSVGGDAVDSSGGSSTGDSIPLIGRERHMEVLHDAYHAACQGNSVTVLTHGSSGMGKSALIRRFNDELRCQKDTTVVLTGRCHQFESVPYKALDSLVDSLSRFLRSLDEKQAERIMPSDILALARLFPVLNRVRAVASAGRQVLEIPDSRELRRRACTALRELFQKMCNLGPVVLYIDDLHWGDEDSGGLLSELLRPPDPPPLLLVVCFRSEEAMSNPLLRAMLSSELAKAATEVRELVVSELSQVQAQKLALRLLKDRIKSDFALAETIARESGGNPFFVDLLVRHACAMMRSTAGETGPEELKQAVAETTMERVIAGRLERLSPGARDLLEIVAVAGRPVELMVVRQVVASEDDFHSNLSVLRAARLIRLRGSRADDEVESYHDRLRDPILDLLDEARLQALHGRLAVVLLGTGRADPETLAVHFEKAGDRSRAAEFAVKAAEQASDALAFERAARLNRIALEFPIGEEGAFRKLQIRLGTALENAGRGAEAAQSFLAAAVGAKAADALELRRRAAEQLMISGHIDAGLDTVRLVLQAIGMKLAPSPTRALLSALWQRVRLQIRGLDFSERDSTQIAPEQLIRIDTCWSVSVGLGIADPILGADFAKRHILLALDAGEPYRVARALSIEAAYSAMAGNKAYARTQELIRASMQMARKVNNPHAIGLANFTAGMAAYLEGRWGKAVQRLIKAEEILRERCTGVTWEIDTSFIFQFRALIMLGDYREINRRLPAMLADVQDRGDLSGETNLRARVSWLVCLVRDDPEQAEKVASEAISNWSQTGFHLQHYWYFTGRIETALYRGEAAAAWQLQQDFWRDMRNSQLLRIQFTRTEARHLRARSALAAAAASPSSEQSKKLLKIAKHDIRQIERERLSWASPLIRLVRAGVLVTEGRQEEATDQLAAAIDDFETANMSQYAAAARLRQGCLIGGKQGRELIRQAKAWMADQEVVRPDRLANVLAPGFDPASPGAISC